MNDTLRSTLSRNPVLWLVCLLPASAVVAGLTTLGIALREADAPLPPAYHWEGANLDRDFAWARAAASRHIGAELAVRHGECAAVVSGDHGDAPTLTLLLTNSNDADLDRVVRLERTGANHYRATCDALPPGHWRIALENTAGAWLLRAQVDGSLASRTLRARDPDGGV